MKLFHAFAAGSVLVSVLATCDIGAPISFYDCAPFAGKEGSPCPRPDCPGECVPVSSWGWSPPRLLWFGDARDEPHCPGYAPDREYRGFADMTWLPLACPSCGCATSAGSCTPPKKFTFHLHPCGEPGNNVTYDPSPLWNGDCTASNGIPPGLACPLGVQCIRAVSAGMVERQEACPVIETPSAPPLHLPPEWKTVAIACGGSPPADASACHDPGLACAVPMPRSAPGFRRCIYQDGDHECTSLYPEKHVFHEDYQDNRSCSPCGCSRPSGSNCEGAIKYYVDASCTVAPPFGEEGHHYAWPEASDNLCVELGSVSGALQSKKLLWMKYNPGTCEPFGGEPEGDMLPAEPTTFCCAPEEPDQPPP